MSETDYGDGLYYRDPYEELEDEYVYAYCIGFDYGAYDYIGGYAPYPDLHAPWIDEAGYADGYWDGYEGRISMFKKK